MSRSESGTGLDGDVPMASVAPVDDIDGELVNGGMSRSGTESDDDENEGEGEAGIGPYRVGELDQAPLRQPRRQQRRRRRTSQQSTTLKQAIQLQHPHSPPPLPPITSVSSSASALPEHFSAHFMFISLVVRIWACLSICAPIMVRPLVLYPVLVMTVVWDRYVLSLISERFLRRKKTGSAVGMVAGARQRRRRSVEQSGMGDEDNALLDRHGSDDQQVVNTDMVTVASATSNTAVDADVEGRQEGSVVLKTRDDDNEAVEDDTEDDKSIKLIWQALLSGVIIQVAWVGAVWLFSRGRVCAVL
ncbi:hypothetical protein BKA57DRAFT_112071 [Linnemannia elongata]|nr:hypothetical protein BKA57DRAFT_112071 [Linnemannia elongata]